MFLDNRSSSSAHPVELLNVAEAAALLTISTTGVRRLQHSRQLPFIKVGGVRFARSNILAFLEKHKVERLDPINL